MNIIKKTMLSQEEVARVEKEYNATYICDMCLMDDDGNYSNFPASYFYAKEAHPEGSNYFALFPKINYLGECEAIMICDGIRITDRIFTGIVAENGDVVYSQYRHDFVESPDGSVNIDGGLEYLKAGFQPGTKPKYVNLEVQGSELVIKSIQLDQESPEV